MDYRTEIVNLSKQFPHLRFMQYISNVVSWHIRIASNRESFIYYVMDSELYDVCMSYNKNHKGS